VKLLFDNCTSPVLAETLNGFVNHLGHEAVHIRNRFAANTTDVEWIAALGSERKRGL
jgi:predicted nuclease of predicted toxin-antitoxin system